LDEPLWLVLILLWRVVGYTEGIGQQLNREYKQSLLAFVSAIATSRPRSLSLAPPPDHALNTHVCSRSQAIRTPSCR
jgi:hypothetical protein